MWVKDIIKWIFKKEEWRPPGMADRFFCTEACDGCGLCYRSCPTGHIRMEKGKPVWDKPCLMCASCADICPVDAIRYGNPDLVNINLNTAIDNKE
ncbi:MAG: 4Fe-4S binding protein [Lachnospiraceae bacterium]|nr:4Fe-4S binding protein [Lachnospiraceae bacterium]